jgi:fatty acid desaturase
MNMQTKELSCFRDQKGEEFREDVRTSGQSGTASRAAASGSRRRLSAEELAPLTRLANWRSAAAVLQTWLVIGVTAGIAIAYWSWPLALAAVVVIATRQHALFILSHDAAHYRLSDHLLRLRAVCEHGGVVDLSSPLTAARTHLPRFNAAWLLARPLLFPHHVNYHVEHHLYPAVPHYHLKRLHQLQRVARGCRGSLDRDDDADDLRRSGSVRTRSLMCKSAPRRVQP